MYNLLILGNPTHFRSSRLFREWTAAGHKGMVIDPALCVLDADRDGLQLTVPSVAFDRVDAIMVFQLGQMHAFVRRLHEQYGCPVFFRDPVNNRVGDLSFSQLYTRLLKAGIPMPKTYFAGESAWEASLSLLPYPIVLKRALSSGKRAIVRVERADQLKEAWELLRTDGCQFMIRGFVPHEKEWRVTILDGEVLAIVERSGPTQDFLSAFREGATRTARTAADVPDVADLAVRAAKASELVFTGVDILQNKETGEYVVIDVNTSPIYRASEEVTEVNIARHLVSYIERRIG